MKGTLVTRSGPRRGLHAAGVERPDEARATAERARRPDETLSPKGAGAIARGG
jgi:hypothetical protein